MLTIFTPQPLLPAGKLFGRDDLVYTCNTRYNMSCCPRFVAEDNEVDTVSDLPGGAKGRLGSHLGARCRLRRPRIPEAPAQGWQTHRRSPGACPLAAAAGGHVKHTGASPTAPGIHTELRDHAWGGYRGSQLRPLRFPMLSTTPTAATA